MDFLSHIIFLIVYMFPHLVIFSTDPVYFPLLVVKVEGHGFLGRADHAGLGRVQFGRVELIGHQVVQLGADICQRR